MFHYNRKTEKTFILSKTNSKFDPPTPTRDGMLGGTFQNFDDRKFWPEALDIHLYVPIWILQMQNVLRPRRTVTNLRTNALT